MTDTLVWFVGYPLSLLFFLFLGISSLTYNKARYKIPDDEFQYFISKYNFPLNAYTKIYNHTELRNFVLPSRHHKSFLQANRLLWSFAIGLGYIALFSTIIEGSILLRGVWIVVYSVAFPISWRLGHTLREI